MSQTVIFSVAGLTSGVRSNPAEEALRKKIAAALYAMRAPGSRAAKIGVEFLAHNAPKLLGFLRDNPSAEIAVRYEGLSAGGENTSRTVRYPASILPSLLSLAPVIEYESTGKRGRQAVGLPPDDFLVETFSAR